MRSKLQNKFKPLSFRFLIKTPDFTFLDVKSGVYCGAYGTLTYAIRKSHKIAIY